MKRTRADALALVNWRGVFYERYLLDPHVTALEGANGAGKTTVMIAAYVVLLPDMSRLRFTNLGETGATGGDKGIWGRLGELGRPSYAVIDFALPTKKRLVAGVHLERHAEPSVEPTPFIVSGLADDVRLQDLLLMRQGDDEVVPELPELRENAARLGGRLQAFSSARDYFAALFEQGVTPLKLSSDEERNKLNEMLRTSMTGGLSRALTSELRDFVLKEEGGLEDTLRRMRANLDACRRTRTEVRESRLIEQEITGVFEAGHTMFMATYLATRERADELSRRVADAEAALRAATEAHEHAHEALSRAHAELLAMELARAELGATIAAHSAWLSRLRDALALHAEVSRLAEVLGHAETAHEAAAKLRGEAEGERVRCRVEVQVARLGYERAAAGLADQQRGIEELHRRAGAYHQVVRRLREAELHLGSTSHLTSELFAPRMATARSELLRVDEERRDAKTQLADAEAHHERHSRVMHALRAFAEDLRQPYEAAAEALRRIREAGVLAERLPQIERALEEARRLEARQQKAQARARALGVAVGEDATAGVDAALADAEAARRVHEHEERSARAEVEAANALAAALEAKRRVLVMRDAEWPRLADIAKRLGVVDQVGLDAARQSLVERQAVARRHEDTLRLDGDRLLREARDLLAAGGPFPPELIAMKDKLEAELVASLFEDLAPDEAAFLEARLGGLARALVVPDLRSAARKVGHRPDSLPDVLLIRSDADLSRWTSKDSVADLDQRDIAVVEDGAVLRVSRIPTHPRLGRRARELRAAELRGAAESKAQEVVDTRALRRQLERLVSESETLLVGLATWLAGDPRSELTELKTAAADNDARLTIKRAAIAHHAESARQLEPRVKALRALLGEAILLEPPDHAERARALEVERDAARQAKALVAARRHEAKILEDELPTLRSAPLTHAERAALNERLSELTATRERLDAGIDALTFVQDHIEALGWDEAPRRLAAGQELMSALRAQVDEAERQRQASEAKSDAAGLMFDGATERFHEADAIRRNAAVNYGAAAARFVALDVPEPTPEALDEASRELVRLEEDARDQERRRDVLLSTRGARETALADAQSRLGDVIHKLANERRDAEPAVLRWERLRERADAHGLARGATPVALIDIRGTPNFYQAALTHRMVLKERLDHARGGDEISGRVEILPEMSGAPEDAYLELWLTVRDWLYRHLPAQVAEVDDPREALSRFRDQLVSLDERMQRQEGELRGQSQDIAQGISQQMRSARDQIKRLNKHLDEVSFGGIQGIRIQTLREEKMELVLQALREGAAQGILFQADSPFEEALDEIFRRFGGGKGGGHQLLDYRQYLRLQVEVRRRSGTAWEHANPTRLSTGEAIGVGAALMMVVLTEWERYATLLRGKKSHGSLRFLFLDEANRLSHDNLGVLFDLCQTLHLQLLIAAPEVARAEGNTTYRLVRTVGQDGREEVVVSGRRTRT